MQYKFNDKQNPDVRTPDYVYVFQYVGDDKLWGESAGLVNEINATLDKVINDLSVQEIGLIPSKFSNPDRKHLEGEIRYYLNPSHFEILEDEKDPEGFRLSNLKAPWMQYKPMEDDFSAPLGIENFEQKWGLTEPDTAATGYEYS